MKKFYKMMFDLDYVIIIFSLVRFLYEVTKYVQTVLRAKKHITRKVK